MPPTACDVQPPCCCCPPVPVSARSPLLHPLRRVSRRQVARFEGLLAALAALGRAFPQVHLSNSAAIIKQMALSGMALTLARPGPGLSREEAIRASNDSP